MQPALFISHGAPSLALGQGPTQQFLSELPQQLHRPSAIVVISAHWETAQPAVLATTQPPTIHDFGGFPQALYQMSYPAPGAPDVAALVVKHLDAAGIPCALDNARGLDHGCWIPLRFMYPDADIPVTQLSVCPRRDSIFHYRLGRALACLRRENILLIGSGAATHNLGDFRLSLEALSDSAPPDYVADFSQWLCDAVQHQDSDALLGWHEQAPHARQAHPSDEHFLPLHVALGAAGTSWCGERIHHAYTHGVICMDSFRFQSLAH